MAEFQSTCLTDCIRYIHRNLGTKLMIPEINAKEISKIITQESLKTYSKFFPYLVRSPIDDTLAIQGKPGFYRIPNLDMLEPIRMRMMHGNNSYAFTNGSSAVPMTLNPIAAQLYDDYLSAVTTPMTWSYWAPNVLERYPKQGTFNNLVIEVESMHPDHLKTIGIKMREHFYKLALLDVLITLQPLRHRFETISSEYGPISLFLEKIDNAASDRDALLSIFEQRSMFTGMKRRVTFA